MATTEDAKVLAVVTSVPELAGDEEANAFFDAIPIPQLASMWCALQRVSRRDQIGSVWAAKVYFDHLPGDQPDRALELVGRKSFELGAFDRSVVPEIQDEDALFGLAHRLDPLSGSLAFAVRVIRKLLVTAQVFLVLPILGRTLASRQAKAGCHDRKLSRSHPHFSSIWIT